MTWQYIVIRKKENGSYHYDIHEYFPRLKSWTIDPVDANAAGSVEGMKWTLQAMLEDISGGDIYEIRNKKLVKIRKSK